jgi:hypothetical protein
MPCWPTRAGDIRPGSSGNGNIPGELPVIEEETQRCLLRLQGIGAAIVGDVYPEIFSSELVCARVQLRAENPHQVARESRARPLKSHSSPQQSVQAIMRDRLQHMASNACHGLCRDLCIVDGLLCGFDGPCEQVVQGGRSIR